MNKIKARITVLTAIVCTVSFAVTGCGKASAVNDKQIRKDVEASLSDISANELKIDSVKVDKRQTSKEDHVDHIWADIAASNENCNYTASCELVYGLYNNGWILDSIDKTDSEIIPKISAEDFSQKIADDAVEEMGYTDCYLERRSERATAIDFTYRGYDEKNTEMVISMNYSFDPVRGWYQGSSAAFSANMFG